MRMSYRRQCRNEYQVAAMPQLFSCWWRQCRNQHENSGIAAICFSYLVVKEEQYINMRLLKGLALCKPLYKGLLKALEGLLRVLKSPMCLLKALLNKALKCIKK